MAPGIAIIGCGKQARKHIKGLRAAGVDQILVWDSVSQAAEDLASEVGVTAASDLQSVWTDPKVQAVDICTPTLFHGEYALQSIGAGKPFLVEKPLTAALDDAQDLVDAARQAGVTGRVTYTYRFVPALQMIRQAILSDEIGPLVNTTLRIGGRGNQAVWKHMQQTGGGAIREMLVHMVDLALWVCGPVSRVAVLEAHQHLTTRMIGGVEEHVDAEDSVTVQLTHANGSLTKIVCDFFTPSFVQYAEFQGRAGTAFGSIQPHFPTLVVKSAASELYEAGVNQLTLPQTNFVDMQMKEFAQWVAGEEVENRHLCSLKEALACQAVIEHILQDAARLIRPKRRKRLCAHESGLDSIC